MMIFPKSCGYPKIIQVIASCQWENEWFGAAIFSDTSTYIYMYTYIYIYGPEIFFGSRRSRVGIITSKNWGYQWVSQHPMIHEVQHRDGYD